MIFYSIYAGWQNPICGSLKLWSLPEVTLEDKLSPLCSIIGRRSTYSFRPPPQVAVQREWRTLGATDSPLQRTSLRSPALLKRMEASKGMPHLIMLLASASAEENPTKDQCSTQHDVGAKWLFQGYPNWECVRECAWYVSLWFFNFSPYRVFQTCASLQAPSSMPLEGLS